MDETQEYEYICPICGCWHTKLYDTGYEDLICDECLDNDYDPIDGEVDYSTP